MKQPGDHLPVPLPPKLAWPAGDSEHDHVRIARGCPAPDVLCGSVDGVLWQVARPIGRSVENHCRDCALCRFDRLEWSHTLTPWERLLALWRRVPLRVRVGLLLLLLFAAFQNNRLHTTNRAMYWITGPVTGHFYLIGGEYDDYSEAIAYARRQRAHPAVVRSEAEQIWLRDRLARWTTQRYLIGLREVDRHGNWQWVTGDPLHWSYWADGEPGEPVDDRLRVAVMRDGHWYAVPVPQRPGEEPIRYSLLEREHDPRTFLEPASLMAVASLLAAGLLLLNILAVIIERRIVAMRIELEYRE